MKITRVCPKCKNERHLRSAWSILFDEDFNEAMHRVSSEDAIRAHKEIPVIHENIDTLSEEIMKLEEQLSDESRDIYLKIKAVGKKMIFEKSRLDYFYKLI